MIHTIKNYASLILILLMAGLTACDSSPQLTPLSNNAVILAFGDSLTYGTGTDKQLAYPAHLQKLLSKTVINAGVPGEVSKTGLNRLGSLLKRHRPELLILCHGGNDMLRHYNLKQTKDNLQKMINLAKASNTQVVLIGVPQFGVYLSSADFYQKLADSNQIPLENTALSDILADARLKSDQIHPNAEGYALFAKKIHLILQQTGAISSTI
ncbi:MAG: arylesterase [Gammaproteobacteria bacterium]|nr:arylesterase [Gammaproteobacteria bacterium]MCK5262638.1 arylesterase [Gammaproteobacteria bacterium]